MKTLRYWLKPLIVFFVLISIAINVKAQFFVTGEDPSFIRWNQINTPDFKIVFPESFQKEANHLATVMDYIYKNVYKSYHHKPRKISVILHTYSSTSNGLVTWAPKRMELYTTPPQNTYAQDWIDQLAVHEMRHVVQLDNLNQGIAYILSYLFGEQVVGALAGFIPPWLLEGDAVNNETALTSTGRGRDASFEMVMKAEVTNQVKLFSYDKAALGSYKDYVPDRYYLGYPLVAWSRKTYKASPNDSTMNFFGHYPTSMLSLPCGIYDFTSHTISNFYKIAYRDLNRQWLSQLASIHPDSTQRRWNSRHDNNFTNYKLPQPVNDTTVLVLKSGIDQLPEFILLYKNGKEKYLTRPGNFAEDKLSYARGNFVWAEEIPDIRWENRSFYCIRKCSVTTGKIVRLTTKTRYFAPSLSPDGSKIAAIEITPSNEFSVVILNSETGQLIQKIPSPENVYIQLPSWSEDGTLLFMLSTAKNGKSLLKLNLTFSTFEHLSVPSYSNMGLPRDSKNYIIYEGEVNGTPNIYAFRKSDQTLWQVTHERYGAFSPTLLTNNTLIYSTYSEKGYNVVSSEFNTDNFIASKTINNESIKLYEKSAQLEHFNFQDSTFSFKNYPVTTYHKILHLFNVHSWVPFYLNYDNLNILTENLSPGLSLLSQNELGTMVSTFGYKYQHGYSYEQASFTYKGWLPAINVILNYGGPVPISKPDKIPAPSPKNDYFHAITRVYLPLNLTDGQVNNGIIPGVELNYEDYYLYNSRSNNFYKTFTNVSYYFTSYSMLKTSTRDLDPRWGVIASAKLLTAPFNKTYGNLYFIQSNVFTPGLLHHHSLKISTAYQYQKKLYYNTQISFPRGLASDNTQELLTGSVDYRLPLWYPDISLSSLFYIKRIQANLFYDLAHNHYMVNNTSINENLQTTGIDITADFHFLRLIFPMNAGLRSIYIPQMRHYVFEFLFSLNLNTL